MKATFTIVLAIACSLASLSLFGQESEITGIQFENEEISISTDFLDCVSNSNGTAKQYLNISVENNLNSPVEVSFHKELWYGGACVNCGNLTDEYLVELKLEAGETVSSDCESSKHLKIFFKMLELKNVRQLSHYELKNITVKKL